MAGTAEVIGGNFIAKFGALKVSCTECTTVINPVEYTPQVASDGAVYQSAQIGATTADMTILVSSITDKQALLDYFGDIKIFQPGTNKLEVLHFARITGGLNHNQKDGTASCSIIAASGEVLK